MADKDMIIKTTEEAIETIKSNMPTSGYQMLRESLNMAIEALKTVQELNEIGAVDVFKGVKVILHEYQQLQQQLKQYREIGTVEECREAVKETASLKNYTEQVKWELDIAEQQLAEIGVLIGQKMDDVKEAVEKQKPKKLEFCGDSEDGLLLCPNPDCGEDLSDLKERMFSNCPYCGQAIDENLEEKEDE